MRPEERREVLVEGMCQYSLTVTSPEAGASIAALLAYFDKHEPAVADAIRYGLVSELECKEASKENHALCVDYPLDA